MGLIGLASTLAREGAKSGIVSNALIPTAGSRMTQTVMSDEMVNMLKPEYVTPLVVYLCSQDNTESGQIFEAGAGWYGQVKLYRSKGVVIPNANVEAG